MMVLLQGMEGEFPYLLQAAQASGVQEAKWMPQQGSPTLNNNKNKDWNLFFMIENLKWVKLLFSVSESWGFRFPAPLSQC